MNDDIFPLVEEEFAGQIMGNEVYELAHQYINQLLWGVFAAGISFIASPVFGSGDFGKMVVTDVVYEIVTQSYAKLRKVTVGYCWRLRLKPL